VAFPSTARSASRPPTGRTRASAALLRPPPFALDRLRELDPERLLYEGTKPGPGGNDPLLLTPLELVDRPPLWCRRRASTATATLACSRERPFTGISAATPNGGSWPFSDRRV
jgi:hypothetical protein